MNTATVARTILQQIGMGNVLAISGGRAHLHADGVVLPVRYGYRVEVFYDYGSDTYTVRRVLLRGAKRFVKGEQTRVHCEEVGEVAYRAACYVNVPFSA